MDEPNLNLSFDFDDVAANQYRILIGSLQTPRDEGLFMKPIPDIEGCLDIYSKVLREIASFASSATVWIQEDASETERRGPLVMVMRHCVSTIDAISVLVAASCIEPANVQLRALMEGVAGLLYMSEADSDRRMRAYQVLTFMDLLATAERMSLNTDRGKNYRAVWGRSEVLRDLAFPLLPGIDARIGQLRAAVESQEYSECIAEINRTKTINRKVRWYSLFDGPTNIYELFKVVGLEPWYEMVYSGLSQERHGGGAIKGKLVEGTDGRRKTLPIRFPDGVHELCENSILFALMGLEALFSRILTGRRDELTAWHLRFHALERTLFEKPLFHFRGKYVQ